MFLLTGLLLWTTVFAQAPDAAALAARLARIDELRQTRPDDGLLIYYRAMTRAALGERQGALSDLRSLLGRRLGLIPLRDDGFVKLWEDAEFQSLRQQLAADEPVTRPPAKVLARLGDPKLIPEGIAYDAKRKRFFIGSMAQNKVVVLDRSGKSRDWSRASDGLDQILGLAVDARRELVWAVSSNGPREPRRNVLVAWRLTDGRLARRVAVPEAAQLNDLAVAPDGTLWVSDSEASTLFRLRPKADRAERVIDAGRLRGANGVALAPDGAIFVTLSTGIAKVNPEKREFTRLPEPATVVSGGIDGLYWHQGDLIGVQNGPNPGRVLRLKLDPRGEHILSMNVLQSHHHPEFDEPTTGAIVGNSIVVIANSQIARREPDGKLISPETLRAPVLLRIGL
jgi:hypothetical protein